VRPDAVKAQFHRVPAGLISSAGEPDAGGSCGAVRWARAAAHAGYAVGAAGG
jgi:hypothetical protein